MGRKPKSVTLTYTDAVSLRACETALQGEIMEMEEQILNLRKQVVRREGLINRIRNESIYEVQIS